MDDEPLRRPDVEKVHVVEGKRDEELIVEHVAGTPGVFDRLVARYAADLYNFFQRFVGNSAAADDLVQETFLQVHLSASSFDPNRSFKPWLYTIAANKGRDHIRARRRRPMQSLDSAGSDPDSPAPAALLEAQGAAVPEEVDAAEQAEAVRRMIGQMPEHLKLILILGYYQKLPYSEIAEILGIPVGTVKSRLHSAVGSFARLWEAHNRAVTPED